ncbi:hypothetical protein MKW94_016975 [Papaver nudicaule]|uniref:Protein kinase domain-containing protein n=1 Tax=Papaver nudicaule TaxID=74823 RepID=A0AA41RVW2_PAPNU|nr:hypothetical protein [Papaver nudicaule]MCL7037559.1 hypothetical protein [Papaver nudicaule]
MKKNHQGCCFPFLRLPSGKDIKTQGLIKGTDKNKNSSNNKKQNRYDKIEDDGGSVSNNGGSCSSGSTVGATTKATAKTFTFQELASATKNFREESVVGEGGFGRVYKGYCFASDGEQVEVAVKHLDRNGLQGNKEFVVEVLMLSLCQHPNLVNMVGYCADGDELLLVYEFMPLGSLEYHLHDVLPNEALDWNTRMKIALGVAKGLEYLHDKANPPVIHRDLKASNILLGPDYYPKLSDFGLAKLGPVGEISHITTRVVGTHGYCAPEYASTGRLTFKSDIYSFGVLLLELITGRKAIDFTLPAEENTLVEWARLLLKDPRKFPHMVDPQLQGRYPTSGLNRALALAALCVQQVAIKRPPVREVVIALSRIASQTYGSTSSPVSTKQT